VALGLRFYFDATKRDHLAATDACLRTLTATGADLSAYNSTEGAADVADLRKVLGDTAWNPTAPPACFQARPPPCTGSSASAGVCSYKAISMT
jgi:hypothetical protein